MPARAIFHRWWVKVGITLLLLLSLSYCAAERGESRRFSGLDLVLFAGGDPDFYFSRLVADGALAAAEDLGVDLELYWSNWESDRMVRQFKEAIETAPAGIAIMGHPGEAAMAPFVREARRKDIVVTSLNVELPTMHRDFREAGFGYVGQDVEATGAKLAATAIRRFDLTPGDTVLVYGVASYPIRGKRTLRAIEAFEEAELEVVYREHRRGSTSAEDRANQATAIVELLEAHPEAALLFDDTDVGSTAYAMRTHGFATDRIPVVGFDLTPEIVEDVREGYIDLIADQQPYLQGYLSVLQLALSAEYGFSGLYIDTGGGYIDAGNIDSVAELVERGVR